MRSLALLVMIMLLGGLGALGVRAVPPPAGTQVAAGGSRLPAPDRPAATEPSTIPFTCPVTPGITEAQHIARHGSGPLTGATTHGDHAASAGPSTTHAHPAAGPPRSGQPSTDHAASHAASSEECRPTPEQAAAAQRLIDDTTAAIRERFAKVSDATAEGYQSQSMVSGPLFHATHYSKWSEIKSPAILDPHHPESLIYGDTRDHGRVLLGALYIMPEQGMKGPEIGGCLTHWHAHGINGQSREMLHVWIVDMPGGRFTENPDPDYIRDL